MNHPCTNWGASGFSGHADRSCFGGAGSPCTGCNPIPPGEVYSLPGALRRGGAAGQFFSGRLFVALPGVFAVDADFPPSYSNGNLGFRCAR